MFTVVETVHIAHPLEGVFDFVADPRNRARWDASVISEELTSPGPMGVGSTLHSRLSAMGREVQFDWRVTVFDAPTVMGVVSTRGPLATGLALELAGDDSATELRATIEASPSGMMLLVEPVISQAVRSNLASGLARVKFLLEDASP